MSNLLTNSRLKTAQSCLRKHAYEYVDWFRPVTESHALTFGRIIHEALEHGPSHQVTGDPLDVVIAEELLTGYYRRWGQFEDVLGVEMRFELPLPGVNLELEHDTYKLAGKIDVLLRDGTIIDHKTTSESLAPDSPLWERLAMDSQISQYFLGAASLGVEPKRWIHDVIRKPEIRPKKATPESERKYTKAGILYANQRAEDETLEEFRLRLREDIALRPDWYFARKEIQRLDFQIETHINNIWETLPLLQHRPMNTESCHRYGRCPYIVCCSTGTHPSEMPSSFRPSTPHPELEV